jgi:hypothetical protein
LEGLLHGEVPGVVEIGFNQEWGQSRDSVLRLVGAAMSYSRRQIKEPRATIELPIVVWSWPAPDRSVRPGSAGPLTGPTARTACQ